MEPIQTKQNKVKPTNKNKLFRLLEAIKTQKNKKINHIGYWRTSKQRQPKPYQIKLHKPFRLLEAIQTKSNKPFRLLEEIKTKPNLKK